MSWGEGQVVSSAIPRAVVIRPELVQLQLQALAVLEMETEGSSAALTGEELVHLRHTQDSISLVMAQRAGVFSDSG